MTDLAVPPVSESLVAEASALLLAPAGLSPARLSQVIASIHQRDVDFADLYFQHARFESWSLEEGIVKAGSFSIDRGVGVRAVSGDRQAYAYSDDITPAALDEALEVREAGRQADERFGPVRSSGTSGVGDGQSFLRSALAEKCSVEEKERSRPGRVLGEDRAEPGLGLGRPTEIEQLLDLLQIPTCGHLRPRLRRNAASSSYSPDSLAYRATFRAASSQGPMDGLI